MNDCCLNNIDKAKWISRATWICPVCGKDVSLMYVLYKMPINWKKYYEQKKSKTIRLHKIP